MIASRLPRLLRGPLALLLAALLLLLAGCGSDDAGSGSAATSQSTASTTAASAFPVSVRHKFGETEVPSAPQRIVSVGLTEHDTVLALGEKPIAFTEWYGDQPDGIWPWARAALGDARPTVLRSSDGFDFEKIAELRPDLILGTNSGMRESDYEKLSALAPTIPAGADSTDYFSPWDQQVELIGQALGKAAEARALVTDVRTQFADAAKRYPELAGKTISFNQNAFYDGLIYTYPAGLNTEFLTYLGLEIEPRVTALASRRGEQVGISAERFDVLDSDLMLFATEKPSDVAKLEKIPTFDKLAAIRENRAVFTDGTLSGAMYFMTPLSLRWVVERLPQQLAAAAAGRAPRRVVTSEPAS